jgi:anaerobic magnesium-protoporphyrin IX monomethyl ester cyclase
VNVRFMERHNENPFNFCRAEAYPGTGLECKLLREGRLLGDAFGYDYRLKDPRSEAFHQIANYAFFERNFSDFGLHYFNMQVDFYFQLLRRFHPEMLSQTLRAAIRNFIKQTNLDTYERISEIYDYAAECDPQDYAAIASFARDQRERVDRHSGSLLVRGERILNWLEATYARKQAGLRGPAPRPDEEAACSTQVESITAPTIPGLEFIRPGTGWDKVDLFGVSQAPVPYEVFRLRLAEQNRNAESGAVCVS